MNNKERILYRHHQQRVEDLFDDYAPTFDEHLATLRYDVPNMMRPHLPPNRIFRKCLDLGCGTGLSGIAFRDSCEYLEGVDISSEILAKARDRPGIYDATHHADLVSYLRKCPDQAFDLLISADVVMYVFDLSMLFEQAKRVTQRDGILLFSTESLDDELGTVVMQESERFAHSRKYVLSISDGFELVSVENVATRLDGDDIIRGDIYVFKRVGN
jgi:predicted TPR repeat methyltransferase